MILYLSLVISIVALILGTYLIIGEIRSGYDRYTHKEAFKVFMLCMCPVTNILMLGLFIAMYYVDNWALIYSRLGQLYGSLEARYTYSELWINDWIKSGCKINVSYFKKKSNKEESKNGPTNAIEIRDDVNADANTSSSEVDEEG